MIITDLHHQSVINLYLWSSQSVRSLWERGRIARGRCAAKTEMAAGETPALPEASTVLTIFFIPINRDWRRQSHYLVDCWCHQSNY